MHPRRLAVALLAAGAVVTSAHARQDSSGTRNVHKPTVNAMCPIGEEPIDPEVKTLSYKGKDVGFCCETCADEFTAWSEKEKDAWVALAVARKEPGQPGAGAAPEKKADEPALYTLSTCPISGKALAADTAVVKVYEGREVRFCCGNCPAAFEKDRAANFAKIDEAMVTDQLPYYPTSRCIVSEEPADEHGKPTDVIAAGRLVRLCCTECKKGLAADPARYIAALDKKVKASQSAKYPLDTCVVSGESLGSMGEPLEMVYAGRLVKFCCKACIKPFKKDPATHLAKIDAAWKAKGGLAAVDDK